MPLALGVGTEGEHEPVVRQLVTILGDHAVLSVLHAVKSSTVPPGAELGRGVLQPEAAHALGLERLLGGHRAIDELQLRRQDRNVDAISSQRT